MISHKLIAKIKQAQIVSFDIFDTLLLRPYMRPEDAFVHIEHSYNMPGFAAWRMAAEKEFYNCHGTSREANIDDIYSVPGHFSNMRDAEMEWESRTLSANPEMKRVFEHALATGKRVIIASDMYLPLDFIKSVLEKNGFSGYHKLYLSNEINRRKDRGDMYGYIAKDLGINPQSILHIGDNKHSDYIQAQRNGFNAYLYTRVTDQYMATDARSKSFYQNNPELGRSIITAMCALHGLDDDYWVDFGYRYAGPVVYAYSQWVYNTAVSLGLQNVLFVARDGYIAQKVFDLISDGKIPSKYVYAPRILNYTANLDYDPFLPEQPRIICEYFKCNTKSQTPAEYIQANLADFQKMASVEKQRTGYADYIRSAVGNNTIVGVVDSISGQMSAQKLIEKESGVHTHGFYWLTIQGRKCLSEFAHSDFLTEKQAIAFQSCNRCDLIELIFSAPESPIITLRDGKPVYQEILDSAEKTRHDIYRRIERGVLAFAADAHKLFTDHDLHISASDMFNLIDLFVAAPGKRDIRAMFDIKKSPYADNSLYVPLFSAPIAPWKISQTRALIWRTPLQNAALVLSRPIRVRMRGLKHIKIFILPGIKLKILNISLFDKYGIVIGGNKN